MTLCDGVLGLRSLLARVPGINYSVNDSDGDRWSLEGYWRTFELYQGTAQDCSDVWVSSMGGYIIPVCYTVRIVFTFLHVPINYRNPPAPLFLNSQSTFQQLRDFNLNHKSPTMIRDYAKDAHSEQQILGALPITHSHSG
jgi:hypothetical protein